MLAQILNSVTTAQTDNDRQFVTALARGLSILSAFEEETELSHQALCQRTQLPKATVTRLIYTLCQTQFLSYNSQTGLDQFRVLFAKRIIRLQQYVDFFAYGFAV